MTRLASDQADRDAGDTRRPGERGGWNRGWNRGRLAMKSLADPRVRLGLGVAGMLLTALPVHGDRVGQRETKAFRAVNGLPDSLYVPVWIVMQLGTLGAAPTAAGVAWRAGDRPLAWRLAAGGTATWALSKFVKLQVRRPRPADLVAGARCRGPEASGLGYLSGHAGVATALGTAAFHRLTPAQRALALGAVPIVGLARIYVGAHLPLDVLGGAGLGLAADATVVLIQQALDRNRPPPRRYGDKVTGRPVRASRPAADRARDRRRRTRSAPAAR